MRRRLTQDDGIVMIVAMFVLMIVLASGLAIVALADSQQGPARDQRQRAASGTLAEAALTAQVFELNRLAWPISSAPATAVCTATAAAAASCPDPGTLAGSFSASASPDYAPCQNGLPQWTTWVRDNGPSADYYTAAANGPAGTQVAYDANNDGKLWVGAQAYTYNPNSARCKLRRFVTQVQAGDSTINIPHNVVTANWLQITGKKKAVVDTTGQHAQPKSVRPPKKQATAQAAAVQVRCTAPLPGGVVDPCLVYTKDQVKPNTGAKVTALPPATFTAAQIQAFTAQAAQDGKWYGTGSPNGVCPPAGLPINGKYVSAGGKNIVVIDDASTCGGYPGGNDRNNPGFLVVKKGMITFAGKGIYYGTVYNANLSSPQLNTKLVYLTGSAVIQGSVIVDGPGGVNPNTKHTAIIYDPRSFNSITVRAGATAVAGTWRELNPNE